MIFFIEWPLLALIPGALFGLLAWRRRRRAAWVAAAVWVAYAFYELGMKRRILCSGECNIRVDLLLLYPLLFALTLVALWRTIRGPREGKDPHG